MIAFRKNIYILKVSLFTDGETIWRKIAIREDQTLSVLHDAIFDAFNRSDEHLYSFFTPSKKTKSISVIFKSPEYVLPSMLQSDVVQLDMEMGGRKKGNVKKTKLRDLNLEIKSVLHYLFDYGDSWWHEITVEEIQEAEKVTYPLVVSKKGESPPQYEDPEDDE